MENTLLLMAKEAGLSAAILDVAEIPVKKEYRKFCEDNLCGNYGTNYSCPPDCGEVDVMHQRILKEEKALVLQSVWEIGSYEDREAIWAAKEKHNRAQLKLAEDMKANGLEGFCVGSSCCMLCNPCKKREGLPCAFPELQFSCMSAYCVDVAETAEKCGLEFAWDSGKLYLYGMIVYHKER